MLTIDEIKKVVAEIAPKYNLQRVTLFGSRANGNFRDDSDVDLIVDFSVPISLLDISELKIDLEEILKKSVDVITRRSLKGSLLTVDKEVAIYEV